MRRIRDHLTDRNVLAQAYLEAKEKNYAKMGRKFLAILVIRNCWNSLIFKLRVFLSYFSIACRRTTPRG